MTTSPAADELGALEQTRFRLEAALASDENWRALTQPGRDDDSTEASTARHARNTRLEMALAGNSHYQAWKHVNGAIAALRARAAAQSQPADPLVYPAPPDEVTREPNELPDDVAALLRDATLEPTPGGVQGVERPPAPADGPSLSTRSGLVQRLERLDEGPPAAAAAAEPVAPSGVEASPSTQGVTWKPERKGHAVADDPPEATVTFVVRETRAPQLPSTELPSTLGTDRNSASFDRLRSLDEAPAPRGEIHFPSKDSGEEAEVNILSAENLKQRREGEERDSIVRRFRKALSGD